MIKIPMFQIGDYVRYIIDSRYRGIIVEISQIDNQTIFKMKHKKGESFFYYNELELINCPEYLR